MPAGSRSARTVRFALAHPRSGFAARRRQRPSRRAAQPLGAGPDSPPRQAGRRRPPSLGGIRRAAPPGPGSMAPLSRHASCPSRIARRSWSSIWAANVPARSRATERSSSKGWLVSSIGSTGDRRAGDPIGCRRVPTLACRGTARDEPGGMLAGSAVGRCLSGPFRRASAADKPRIVRVLMARAGFSVSAGVDAEGGSCEQERRKAERWQAAAWARLRRPAGLVEQTRWLFCLCVLISLA